MKESKKTSRCIRHIFKRLAFGLLTSIFTAACVSAPIEGQNAAETTNSPSTTRPTIIFPAEIPPSTAPVLIDLVYCTSSDGIDLTMDLYKPLEGKEPFPAVVYIHGGGWTSGDKTDGVGLFFREELNRRGYIFASINYRLAPKYTFPDPLLDVKCAIRSLRANSELYGLNPDEIGVMGGSAGGQLAALLGTSSDLSEWNVGEYTPQSSKVGAVVDMFGPADLMRMFQKSGRPEFLDIFGAASSDDPVLIKFSPVSYIDANDPPFLILHGDQDQSIPLEQSQILFEALQKSGVPAELIIVKNAGHSFLAIGGRIKPNIIELAQKVADFFDQHLKGNK